MILMITGACAGSTAGGLKLARALLLFKTLRRNARQVLHPNRVQVVRNNGQVVSEKVLEHANAYFAAYIIIILVSFLLISLDEFSLTTNFTAVLACFNNVGPGFEGVGPSCSFAAYSPFSKLVLTVDMLAGRLEIFPILALFAGAFLLMTYSVIPFDEMGLSLPSLGWWFPELSALFLVSGIVIGLVDRRREDEIAETFVAGCADMLGVALIIGISRGITVLMNDGSVTDTVLHWGESALSGAGPVAFVLLVFLLYLPLSFLIPSSSGLATLSVPIVAPLGQFAGVSGALVVTAFQSACGLVNLITPTAAVVMGALALGHVPYDRWVKFSWKLLAGFLALTLLLLAAGRRAASGPRRVSSA